MPQSQNVTSTVKSIVLQLEASGVKYQGLAKWNISEPITSRTMTTARATIRKHPPKTLGARSAVVVLGAEERLARFAGPYSMISLPFINTKWPGNVQKYV
jgi:hypothetical protein